MAADRHTSHEHGAAAEHAHEQAPHGGSDASAHDHSGSHKGADHAHTESGPAHGHGAHGHAAPDDAAHDHGGHEHGAHDHGAHKHGAHDHGAHDHGAHDHGAHDHSGHAGHDPAIFRRKFWLSLVLTIPTLVFSHGLQEIVGLDGPRFPGSEFIPAVFGTILFFYGGLVFLRGGVDELRAGSPGMMTLISLAIVVAFGYSAAVTLGLEGMDFWWELATLITIMLLGHWIEMSAVMSAGNALGALASLLPDRAERLLPGADPSLADDTETVPVSELATGDLVVVRPGQAVPADGDVVDGEADVDESLLTGESRPVRVAPGVGVVAGSIVTGALTVKVARTGEQTALAGIMRLVAEAQASKSPAQLLADRAAKWLFYVAVAVALVTVIAWAIIRPDDPAFTLERVVTVLIIACPHALGLAIPLVAQISTSIGARVGLLVRDRAALEEARRIQVVVFDKTGTLTQGRQGVVEIGAHNDRDDELLSLAAAAESRSEHPIARAIVAAASERGLSVVRAESMESLAGRGVTARVGERTVAVLSPGALSARSVSVDDVLAAGAAAVQSLGHTVVWVTVDDQVAGYLALADVIRPEAREAVSRLRARGVRVAMVTGDAREVADAVAAEVGIDEVLAEVLPEDKAATIRELQKGGTRVAMVGDGVNDAPALAQADIGIAIGAGTDVAIESAGIVLASDDPRGVDDVLTLSTATYRKMAQNLGWAVGYNVISLPLATGVAIGIGLLVSPAVGAILMSLSTIVVALNAQLLRRLKLGGR
ncbi:heavy metal translocating P-type ATPase [Amnibacterium flavum]|uniref:Heavy metal translocating P-type ATPase n=1 Tax=Amnibacterium flavum TaxID=2173173 RepID=A0A2V1HY73_9MICO|nr:heavy metal translocating P-type ATPase [Amnibacterium flavum]PVZ96399.1 heavy metal translocating P-type ATPase [Amnibacterium flavum]